MSDTCETCGIGSDLHGAVCGGTDQPSPPERVDEKPRAGLASGASSESGGGAGGVPAGWKLAPGWEAGRRTYDTGTFVYCDGACLGPADFVQSDCEGKPAAGACQAHAVEMGALVKVEPTEQPVSAADELPAAEAIDWSRFVPTEEPRCGETIFEVGAVYQSWNDDEGSVLRWTRGPRGSEGCRFLAGRFFDFRACRLIRHADGRWADGYGPNGPTSAPPEPASRQGEQVEQRDRAFDWRRLGCGETSRSARLACAGNDGGPHDEVCDLVTRALEDQHQSLGALVAGLTARLDAAERERDELRREFDEHETQRHVLVDQLCATERERDEATAKLADMEARARDAERDADIAELKLATGAGTPTP